MKTEEIQQKLLSCLRKNTVLTENIFADFQITDWEEFISLAKRQYVLNLLYYRLKEERLEYIIPSEKLKEMQQYFQAATMNNLRLKGELTLLAREFARNDIPVVALKGSHLAFFIYPHIALRFMRDIDLLVPAEKSREAFAIAENLGYKAEQEEKNIDFDFNYFNHLPQMIKNNKFVLEIHGNILKPDKAYSIPDKSNWINLKKVKDNNMELLTFGPEELIMHLCMHISYKDSFNLDLRHYYDIVIALDYYKDFDWEKFISESIKRKWSRGIYLVLKTIEKLFETGFPENINRMKAKTPDTDEFVNYIINVMWEYDRSSEKHSAGVITTTSYNEYLKKGLPEKIKIIYKRIFIPRTEMAFRYSIKHNSPKIYYYYFTRLLNLFRKHKTRLEQVSSDDKFRKYLDERATLYNWLNS